jgi:hypothetical protein
MLSDPTALSPAQPDPQTPDEPGGSIQDYLHKLMMAESGGKLTAKNPLSTALGPYQFINSTFLSVVKRHLANEVAGKSNAEILALRTNLQFSRRAAIAFNSDNAAFLEARGVPATFANLRLAYLLGPQGAVQALRAGADTSLTKVFSSAVIKANPFMSRLTVAGLMRRAEREVGVGRWTTDAAITEANQDPTPIFIAERSRKIADASSARSAKALKLKQARLVTSRSRYAKRTAIAGASQTGKRTRHAHARGRNDRVAKTVRMTGVHKAARREAGA